MKKYILKCVICLFIALSFKGLCKIEGTAPERIKNKIAFLLEYNINYEETFTDLGKGMVRGWKKIQSKD